MKKVKKVLVLGNSVRNIACSARKAGYIVDAFDHFGDVDTRKCANKTQILENIPFNELRKIVESFGDIDAIIPGPGFENLELKNTLSNPLKIIEDAGDKSK